ncbi:MAG: peptidylprolyl isomerase [Labilithrix sp.]|nr:peptidylprolyl isomerase [Labilithrix sp.]
MAVTGRLARFASVAAVLTSGLGWGCGGGATPAASPAPEVAPVAATATDAPPLAIEYVVVRRRWVEALVPAPPDAVKAWANAPENAAAATGPLRQLLVKVPGGEKDPGLAAKKKAAALAARAVKGEDFATLARQHSDDATTRDGGGELARGRLDALTPPLRAALDALAPGETTAEPVRSSDGFYVLHKERASEERIEAAYRKAKAPAIALQLGEELLARLDERADSRPAIAEAVEAVLGERGVNDAERPRAQVVDRERLAQVRLTAAAKAALEAFARGARAGERFPAPAVDGDTIVVARARAGGPR